MKDGMFLDRDRGNLAEQIAGNFREMILSGSLHADAELPSSRELAGSLEVSRNTVNLAYSMLEAEGYIRIAPGKRPRAKAGASRSGGARTSSASPPRERYSPLRTDLVDFRSGIPDPYLFPLQAWKTCLRQAVDSASPEAFRYGEPEGRPELRRAIAEYIGQCRGVRCSPDHIVVTAGTTQAIGIVSRILLAQQRRHILVEDPLTSDIKKIIVQTGGVPIPVPVDEQGLRTDLLRSPERLAAATPPAFVYVTPSHQFPLGATLPIQRRLDLLSFADEMDCYVVEDDYDSEFRYSGLPLRAMQALSPERVIYIGTFSKILSPSLRFAYIVLPEALVESARQQKWLSDLHNPIIDQLGLARFVADGYLSRHIERVRRIYARRRRLLKEALESGIASHMLNCRIVGTEAGLHLSVRCPGITFGADALTSLEKHGVKVYAITEHSLLPDAHRDEIIMGYGHLSPAELERGATIFVNWLAERTGPGGRKGSVGSDLALR